jgi:putative transcriptional regulator
MENLRKARLAKKLSQKELADELGVTTATISRYESGERKLPVETAKRIAEILGVDWYTLFDEEEQGL